MLLPAVSATAWNAIIAFLIRHRVLGVTVLESGGWSHPWSVTPEHDAKLGWMAAIRPGFVNGEPATVLVDEAEVPLTEDPRLSLSSFRALGVDGQPTGASTRSDGSVSLSYEEVPDFFAALGVGQAPALTLDGESLPDAVTLEAGARLLRACDIVLHMDRQATRTSWTEGIGIDGLVAQFNVTATSAPNARKAAYLRSYALWTPPAPTQGDMLSGSGWEDSTWDELRLATVFLLSPPGTALGADPDEKWTPYVRHDIFWNLNHATNHLKPPLATVQLSLNTGLAGGLGDTINNTILAQVNDADSAAAQFLSREKIEGRFWTV